MAVQDVGHALALLMDLGARPRLVLHHELVVEAAREIIEGLDQFSACFDGRVVLIGAALHDAGKVLHPEECDGPGHDHELAGHDLLAEHGLGDLARFSITHARWDAPDMALEDLLVALADKLWKGKRVSELERRVVERLAANGGLSFWDVFVIADDLFERVAATGDQRLARSVCPWCFA